MSDWSDAVAQLGIFGVERYLQEDAQEFLLQLPDKSQPLLLACSGGADSVFLLLLMAAWCQRQGMALRVLHFNHGLRGAEADADADFVADIAGELQLPYACGHAAALERTDEGSLRFVRYQWMEKQYFEHGAAALLLGHHADDAVESLLMATLSGAGLSGLTAPRPVVRFANGHVRVRPILHLRREEIEHQLHLLRVPWREDATNALPIYTRNWLRHDVIPMLNERLPQDVCAGMTRTRELLQEALQAIDCWVGNLQLDMSSPGALDLRAAQGAPRAVLRRALMRWWLLHYAETLLPKDVLEELLDQIEGFSPQRAIQVSAGFLFTWRGEFELARVDVDRAGIWQTDAAVQWHPLASDLYLPGGGRLTGCICRFAAQDQPYRRANPAREAWLAMAAQPLLVRRWRKGDRYRPLGAPGRRKLQDLFTDAKLEREQKHSLPVICNTHDEILWVPGFPPADSVCLDAASESALKLTYLTQCPPLASDYGG